MGDVLIAPFLSHIFYLKSPGCLADFFFLQVLEYSGQVLTGVFSQSALKVSGIVSTPVLKLMILSICKATHVGC